MAVTAGTLLDVEALSFGYRRRPVGRDASFSLRAGEVLALLGPNGGGKTTLFKTILGLLHPHAGRIRVEGADIAAWRIAERARIFGYVPQAAPGYFPFTVTEMVLMGRAPRVGAFAAPSRRDHDVVAAALKTLDIAHLAARDYTRISGGERQLALIARALAQEPRILVLDEPTSNLDFGNQQKILDVVRDLARRGLGILLSTHHPDHAFDCATHAMLLKDGVIVGSGPVRESLTAASLTDIYGVPVGVADVKGRRVCIPVAART